MYLLLTDISVTIGGKMSIGVWLPIGGGVKASTVVRVEGLLQF